MTVDYQEVFEALADIEKARVKGLPQEGMSMAELSKMILPEFTEEEREAMEMQVILLAVERLATGMSSSSMLVETFLRGVEVGREVERRIK